MREIIFLTEENLEESKKYKRMSAEIQKNPALFAKLSPEDQSRVQSHVWGHKVAGATAAKRDALDKVAVEGKADPKKYGFRTDDATARIRQTAAELGDVEDEKLQRQIQSGKAIKSGASNIAVEAPSKRLETQARGQKIAQIAGSKAGNMSQKLYNDAASKVASEKISYDKGQNVAEVATTMAKQRGDRVMSNGHLTAHNDSRVIVPGRK